MTLSQILSPTNQLAWLQTITVQILLKWVMLIRLFHCSRCSWSIDTFVHCDSPSGSLRWKFHNSQWERADMEASAARCCIVLRYAPLTASLSSSLPGFHSYPFLSFSIKHIQGQQDSSWRRVSSSVYLIFYYSHAGSRKRSVWFSVAFVLLSSYVFKIGWDLITACGQH